MMLLETFPPTRQAALKRVSTVRPSDYARSRNAIEGAVTGLSPYITHGLLSLPEVLAGVTAKHSLDVQHKFVFELGWREYFRHVHNHARMWLASCVVHVRKVHWRLAADWLYGHGPRTALSRPLTCWPPGKPQRGEPTWNEI